MRLVSSPKIMIMEDVGDAERIGATVQIILFTTLAI